MYIWNSQILVLILKQMLLAVHAIHEVNIIHSDLKPAVFFFWILYVYQGIHYEN